MTFRALNLCLPMVLAVHNAEEYLRYDAFLTSVPAGVMRKFVARRVLRNALLLLTASAALSSTATYIYDDKRLIILSRAAIFALLLNGLGHIAASLVRQRCEPGTVSAVLLILPYSAAAMVAMRVPRQDRPRFLLRYGVLGAATLFLASAGFLSISYGLVRAERLFEAA